MRLIPQQKLILCDFKDQREKKSRKRDGFHMLSHSVAECYECSAPSWETFIFFFSKKYLKVRGLMINY
jgi:hypothetical protein